jgi:predicted PurR-regulated permease PerM
MMGRRIWHPSRDRGGQPGLTAAGPPVPGDPFPPCPPVTGDPPGSAGPTAPAGPPVPDGAAAAGQPPPAELPRLPWPEPAGRRDATAPLWLQRAAGWAWRLIVVGVLVYLGLRVASALRLVVLPCIAALLLTALLQPLAGRLRRAGLPEMAATWCTLLAAGAVLAGLGTLAVTQTSAAYPALVREVGNTSLRLQRWLAGPPFHLHQAGLQQLSSHLLAFLKQHQSLVAGTVLSGGRLFAEVLAGLVLMVFVTFFLLKDGDRIWAWLTSFLGTQTRQRAREAGSAAWQALTYYARGTTAVAAIHAVVIGFTLWVLGVPLLAPLVILVFLAAFVPLVGILVAGALAVAVTLATRGWIAAVVLVAVFILENQLEGHLLQPQVVGRMVRLHPLAIILVLAVGGVIGGIPGAAVAVPVTLALVRAVPYLRGAVAGQDPEMAGQDPGTAGGKGGEGPGIRRRRR